MITTTAAASLPLPQHDSGTCCRRAAELRHTSGWRAAQLPPPRRDRAAAPHGAVDARSAAALGSHAPWRIRERERTPLCAPSPLFFCRGAAVKRRRAPSKAGGSRVTRLAPPPSHLAALCSEENLWLCVFCEGSDAASSINAIRQIIAPAATRAPASKALCCRGVGRVGTGLFLGSHESSSRTPATVDAVSALHTRKPCAAWAADCNSRNQHTL